MQTIERPQQERGPDVPRRSRPVAGWGLLAGGLLVPVLVMLVFSRWGVLVALLLAGAFGLGMWIWRRGIVFIEIVAFLIHFDLTFSVLTVGRIMAVLSIAVIIYKFVAERWRPPAIPRRHWLPILMLVTFALISGAWSDSVVGYEFALGTFGLALAYYGVSALLIDSHRKIQQYLRAYWVGGLFGSAAGVVALFLGTRSVGLGSDPNFFGLLEASMIPLTVYYRRNETDSRKRLFYAAALLLVLAGAAGAGSRSGLIGGAVAIFGTMVTRPGISSGRRVRVAVGAVLLAGLAFVVGFVANPNNLQRGLVDDRGAGRLDLWTVTVDLINDRPVLGHGFGQIKYKTVPALATTPGVEKVTEGRTDVSSHNTWLDIIGDLGVVGLLLYVSVFVVTFLGFLRPRWRQTKELSTTLAVMMLPVMTGTMFLPLFQNKLAWSLIGLSAALQVPSWGTRWHGYLRSPGLASLPAAGRTTKDGQGITAWSPATVDGKAPAAVPEGGGESLDWDEPVLARWDLRVSRRFRFSLLAGAVIGFVLFSTVMAATPDRYTANADIVTQNGSAQIIHTLVVSGAYAAELKRLSGVDLSVPEIRDRMSVVRPGFGSFQRVQYADTDEAHVQQVLPHLIDALDTLVADSRAYGEAQTQDELRPINPGERRTYDGPLYLRTFEGEPFAFPLVPPRSFVSQVGAVTGMLLATGFVLLQQRRPRVNNDDDIPGVLGMPLWTHVGRAGRRFAATGDQYAQVVTVARELAAADESPRRLVVASPRPDRAARGLAMGVAAAIAAEGGRVLLVDMQAEAPMLSMRLAGPSRRGLVDVADGTVTLDSVVRKVNRWRLPLSVRRTVGSHIDRMRFVPVGRVFRRPRVELRPDLLDRFGPDVTVVVLAPPLLGQVPAGHVLAWGDAVVLALVEGRTVTFDAEDAAVQMRTFAQGVSGAVLLDV